MALPEFHVIGLRGVAGVGKTTLCGALASRINQLPIKTHAHHMSFAGPIKRALADMGITKDGTPTLYRSTAQYIGAAGRAHNQDHWVNLFNQNLGRFVNHYVHFPGHVFILIDDVRFSNEADYIEDRSSITIGLPTNPHVFFIEREGQNGLIGTPFEGHESEAWNEAGPGSHLTFTNHQNNAEETAQEILNHVMSEFL